MEIKKEERDMQIQKEKTEKEKDINVQKEIERDREVLRQRQKETERKSRYTHVQHNDVLVKDGSHTQWSSNKIIMELKIAHRLVMPQPSPRHSAKRLSRVCSSAGGSTPTALLSCVKYSTYMCSTYYLILTVNKYVTGLCVYYSILFIKRINSFYL